MDFTRYSDIMQIEQMERMLWIVVGVLATVQLLYIYVLYHAIHRRNVAYRKGKVNGTGEKPGISVIIVASDNEQQLAENLPRVLSQDYPDYEVIVVNDNSQDDTEELLERLSQKYPHLYTTFTSDSIRYISRQKLALTLGIKAAKKDWLVFTAPDCFPVTDQWLTNMARNFTETTDVVIGYSNYVRKPGFANLCYVYDTLLQQLRMLGLTLLGRGYMGIGRNMAYRRELFFQHKGYSRHLDLQRGEDDLFINEHISAQRIVAEVSAEASVRCGSANSYYWKSDKLNRLFIRHKMKGIAPYLLGLETFSRLLFYTFIIIGVVYSVRFRLWVTLGVCVGLWLLRFGSQILVFHHTARDLGERRYNVSIPLFDVLQPLWSLYFRMRLLFGSKRPYMRNKI